MNHKLLPLISPHLHNGLILLLFKLVTKFLFLCTIKLLKMYPFLPLCYPARTVLIEFAIEDRERLQLLVPCVRTVPVEFTWSTNLQDKLLLTRNGAVMVLQESEPFSLFDQMKCVRKKKQSSLHWDCLDIALLGLSCMPAQWQILARWGYQEILSFRERRLHLASLSYLIAGGISERESV